jgi:signal transduction histidine kinase/FixJ family two-component response regulator
VWKYENENSSHINAIKHQFNAGIAEFGQGPAGNIQVYFGTEELFAKQGIVWRNGLIIALLCLLMFLSLLVWQAIRLAFPLRNVAKAVAQISQGKLDIMVKPRGTGDLLALENGVNAMAQALQNMHRNLEAQIDRATVHMRLQRDEANRASAAKSRFLASASHDLRQPMHALGLFCTALSQKVKEPEQQKLIANIQMSLHAMEDLFEALLDMSRLDTGRIQADVQALPIAEVLQWVHLEYSDAAFDKGLRFRVRPSPLWIHADVTLLRRVLLNLTSNAIRYTRKGGILVGVRRSGHVVRIEVWDSGIGIPAAQLAHIFDEFVQLDNPERDRTKGLGLGLSIAQKSAQLMGTNVEVRSQAGRGSCFCIALPLAIPPAVDTTRLEPQTHTNGGSSLMGRRIVIIEDDQISLEAMTVLLAQWGAMVLASSSGEQALALIDEKHFAPEIIISDYRLRNQETGLEAIQKIRSALHLNLPAVIVTGELEFASLVGDRNEQWVLKKPVDAWQLKSAILHGLAKFAQEQLEDAGNRRANRLLRHAPE